MTYVEDVYINRAYIDGQNLHLGTTHSEDPWQIDFKRLFVYLQEKYQVGTAYYFFGQKQTHQAKLFAKITRAGFTLVFKQHHHQSASKKKGNVDVDLAVKVAEELLLPLSETPHNIILVTGDGDFKCLVDLLISLNRLEKILFPNQRKASSLYKKIHIGFKSNLSEPSTRKKISYRNEKASLGN